MVCACAPSRQGELVAQVAEERHGHDPPAVDGGDGGAHDQVVGPLEDGLHKAVLYLIVCKAFDFVQADQGGEVSLY